MDESVDQHDEFYDYFNNRPVALAFMVIFGSIVSILEIASNILILVVKLRRSSEKTGFDMLIVNLAIMFIISGTQLVHFMIDELFYEFTNDALCNSSVFFTQFASTSIVFSLLALVVVARFWPDIGVRSALRVVCVIWIASSLNAFPYNRFSAETTPLKDGKVRNVCNFPSTYTGFLEWRHYYVVMNVTLYAIPAVLFAIASVIAVFFRSSKSTGENRQMVIHAVIMGSVFIVFECSMRALEMVGYFYYNINYGFEVTLMVSMHLIGVINIVLYGYFNKLFYKQVCHFLNVFNDSEFVDELEEI